MTRVGQLSSLLLKLIELHSQSKCCSGWIEDQIPEQRIFGSVNSGDELGIEYRVIIEYKEHISGVRYGRILNYVIC